MSGELVKRTTDNREDFLVATPLEHYCNNIAPNNRAAEPIPILGNQPAGVPSPLLRAKLLKIKIIDVSRTCDKPCLEKLSSTILSSIGLWRSGCARCSSASLNLVEINNSLWLDSITHDKWSYALNNSRKYAQYDPHSVSRVNFANLGRQPVADYIRAKMSKVTNKICSRENLFTMNDFVESQLCNRNNFAKESCPSEDCFELPIYLGKENPYCELTESKIACGSPDGAIALNTDNYKFLMRSKSLKIENGTFGEGPTVLLQHTITHEVGHWFGLQHDNDDAIEAVANIMFDGYSRGREWCLTLNNLKELNEAVDKNWKDRLSSNSGLRYIK
ncbi:hypothetical protein DFR28_101917 [Arenicella xantha]|uniref:Matrixin n=2 Tax=Arenicella xantha TaxID=644221 RepID=A0A395JPF6_9GAMM|nr:hypothetical protein DFR28_101917 [Arenicella xantha]